MARVPSCSNRKSLFSLLPVFRKVALTPGTLPFVMSHMAPRPFPSPSLSGHTPFWVFVLHSDTKLFVVCSFSYKPTQGSAEQESEAGSVCAFFFLLVASNSGLNIQRRFVASGNRKLCEAPRKSRSRVSSLRR